MLLFLYMLAAATVVCLVSLVGGFTLFVKPALLQRIIQWQVALAVGVLLGDAFLHLIPDAIARIGDLHTVLALTLVGILLFFLVEKGVRGHHSHRVDAHPVQPLAKMNLAGDAIHNFLDGILIAGSFSISPLLGITTTAAIVAHEIPQELGDVGVLIHGGYSPRRAILVNFLCALTCIAGVVFTFALGAWSDVGFMYLLPIAAGGFIYIAVSDFIPSLHTMSESSSHWIPQIASIVIGVGSMQGILFLEM